jgi:hypothetical protein
VPSLKRILQSFDPSESQRLASYFKDKGRESADHGSEGVSRGDGRPFVAVDEGMVLRKAFPQSGRFLDQVSVTARSWSEETGLEQAAKR